MKNPTCGGCSKTIPDGFVDCPWCGAQQSAPLPGNSEDVPSPGLKAVYGLLSLVSFTVVILLVYVGTGISKGPVFPQNSAYFFGACAGAFTFPAFGLFLYYKVSRKAASDAKKLLLITTWALLPASLTLSNTLRQNPGGQKTAELHHIGDLLKQAENADFLRAYHELRNSQDSVLAQMGVAHSDFLPPNRNNR